MKRSNFKILCDRADYYDVEGSDKYFLIMSRYPEDFTRAIADAMELGFVLIGSPYSFEGKMYQAMAVPFDFNKVYTRVRDES